MKYLQYELESTFIGGLERIYNISLNDEDCIIKDGINTGLRLIDIDLINGFIDVIVDSKLEKVTVTHFLTIIEKIGA